jgi:purine-binding chemotaxis protein CheW
MPRLLEGGAMDLVVFEIGGLRYALPAADVGEIVRAVRIVPLPGAPAIVEGVIDVRGRVVPVLDIRQRFERPAKALAHTDHLVLASVGSRLVAIRVDRALDVVRVEGDTVEDTAALPPCAAHLSGVARLPDGLVLIHDLRTFLQDAETASLDDAVAARSPGPTT